MDILQPELLQPFGDHRIGRPEFHAVYNAHGLYNTLQFVLRLSPLVHSTLSKFQPGISTNGDLGFAGAQAMSTFLHETIHWWQHIGSTYGFVFGLNYPVQAHVTHHDLRRLVEADGFKKSVFQQSLQLGQKSKPAPNSAAGLANIVVNNHFDLLTFRTFTLGPDEARKISRSNLFESVGHAFHMTYAHTVSTLAATVDPDFKTFMHPKEWQGGFAKLRNEKVDGYYYGSPIVLRKIGAQEIFEGQARFSQIQFLSHACGHRLTLDDYRTFGMLDGVYVKAFDWFLQLIGAERPESANDPLIGLFLLVCDQAINPSSGFPFNVSPFFESFIDDVNPGARFDIFCVLIARKFPVMKKAIIRHDRSEYETLTDELAEAVFDVPPRIITGRCAEWFSPDGSLASLRKEYEEYDFRPENFVIRHLLAHFLAFQEDKAKRPEFFCWPGAWLAGDNLDRDGWMLFEKHGTLFIDKEDDDSIFPRLQIGRSEATVHKIFDEFYHNVMTFDLTEQWISQPGPFQYDVSWASAAATKEDAERYLRGQFEIAYGLDPNQVSIL